MSNAPSTNLLHDVYLFKDLTEAELAPIAEIAKADSYNGGDEIFIEGDNATALYVIKFGTVRIKHSGKNDSINVSTLGTGSHFGEMAFVDREKRSATVEAVEKSDILRLDFDDLRKVLDGNPGTAVKVYRSLALFLCGRLRVTTNDLSFSREKNLRHF